MYEDDDLKGSPEEDRRLMEKLKRILDKPTIKPRYNPYLNKGRMTETEELSNLGETPVAGINLNKKKK